MPQSDDLIARLSMLEGLLLGKDTSADEAISAMCEEVRDHIAAQDAEIARLKAENAKLTAEQNEAHAYLSRLLTKRAPRTRPLNDLDGVVSQIDNLLMGMVPEAEARRVPAGWRLVPVEATGAMCAHGESRAVDFDCAPADDIANQAMRAIYRAMLAAAPQPPQEASHDR